VVTALSVVSGVECMLIAHDPTVRGGASNPFTWKKVLRALEICRQNRLPVINLVESAGGDLPSQAELFLPAGRLFHDLTELSAMGIPSVALVFGNSTAGVRAGHVRLRGDGQGSGQGVPRRPPVGEDGHG
jgi:acetyl-CoA carboxylase carboxyltransferase component